MDQLDGDEEALYSTTMRKYMAADIDRWLWYKGNRRREEGRIAMNSYIYFKHGYEYAVYIQ